MALFTSLNSMLTLSALISRSGSLMYRQFTAKDISGPSYSQGSSSVAMPSSLSLEMIVRLPGGQGKDHLARLLLHEEGHAAQRVLQGLLLHQRPVLLGVRDDPAVVGELAVDEVGGEVRCPHPDEDVLVRQGQGEGAFPRGELAHDREDLRRKDDSL